MGLCPIASDAKENSAARGHAAEQRWEKDYFLVVPGFDGFAFLSPMGVDLLKYEAVRYRP